MRVRQVFGSIALSVMLVSGGIVGWSPASQATSTTPTVAVTASNLPTVGLSPAPTGPLTTSSISCPTSGWCAAIGQYPSTAGANLFVGTLQGSTWSVQTLSLANLVPPVSTFGLGTLYGTQYPFIHLSCPTETYCEAVGEYGGAQGPLSIFSVTLSNGHWTVQNEAALSASGTPTIVTGLSCPAVGSCVGSGIVIIDNLSYSNYVANLSDGTWTAVLLGSVVTPPQGVVNEVTLLGALLTSESMSCVTITSCEMVGLDASGGFSASQGPDGQWSSSSLPRIGPPTDMVIPLGISCPAVGDCVTVGTELGTNTSGYIGTLTSATWSASTLSVDGSADAAAISVSCAAVGHCVLSGEVSINNSSNGAFIAQLANGSWTNEKVPTTNLTPTPDQLWPVSLSCSSLQRCVAVGTAIGGGSALPLYSFAVVVLSPPLAPNHVSAKPSNGAAQVSWTASSEATRYVATASPGGKYCTTTTTSCVISGLNNGTRYVVSVSASNSAGNSLASSSTSVTPMAPMAPTTTTVPTVSIALANTGTNSSALIVVALALLGLGAGLFAVVRQRRSRS